MPNESIPIDYHSEEGSEWDSSDDDSPSDSCEDPWPSSEVLTKVPEVRLSVAISESRPSILVYVSHPCTLSKWTDPIGQRRVYTWQPRHTDRGTRPTIAVASVPASSREALQSYTVVQCLYPPPALVEKRDLILSLNEATGGSADSFDLKKVTIDTAKRFDGSVPRFNGLHPGELIFECKPEAVDRVRDQMVREGKTFVSVGKASGPASPSLDDPPLTPW